MKTKKRRLMMLIFCWIVSSFLMMYSIQRISVHYQMKSIQSDAAFLIKKSDNLIGQISDTLDSLKGESLLCNDETLRSMRYNLNKNIEIYDVGIVNNGRVICSAKNGVLPTPVELAERGLKINGDIYFYKKTLAYPGVNSDVNGALDRNIIVMTPPLFYQDRIYDDAKNLSVSYRDISGDIVFWASTVEPEDGLLYETGKVIDCSHYFNSCVEIADHNLGVMRLGYQAILLILFFTLLVSSLLVNALKDLIENRNKIEKRLKIAVQKNKLSHLYQPIVESSSGRIIGMEALLRWEDKVLGRVSPETFIPLSETIGVGKQITKNLLVNTLSDMRCLLEKYEFYISFNVGTAEVLSVNFISSLNEITDSFQVRRNQIKIEVTEKTDLPYELILGFVERLKLNGYEVAMDDFGTGTSNLQLIPDSEFDVVKIDRFFISKIENDLYFKLVKDMVSFISGCGKKIIFEGVEKTVELNRLKAIVDSPVVQGWLFYRPLNKSEFAKAVLFKGRVKQR